VARKLVSDEQYYDACSRFYRWPISHICRYSIQTLACSEGAATSIGWGLHE
jgi:hypothetical protein